MGALTTPRNPEEYWRAHLEPSQALHITMNPLLKKKNLDF